MAIFSVPPVGEFGGGLCRLWRLAVFYCEQWSLWECFTKCRMSFEVIASLSFTKVGRFIRAIFHEIQLRLHVLKNTVTVKQTWVKVRFKLRSFWQDSFSMSKTGVIPFTPWLRPAFYGEGDCYHHHHHTTEALQRLQRRHYKCKLKTKCSVTMYCKSL